MCVFFKTSYKLIVTKTLNLLARVLFDTLLQFVDKVIIIT